MAIVEVIDDQLGDGFDMPVHDYAPTMRNALRSGNTAAIQLAAANMLNLDCIRFWKKSDPNDKKRLVQVTDGQGRLEFHKYDRVGSVNEFGDAYSAMEQGDLGLLFWNAYSDMIGTEDAKEYRNICFSSLEVFGDSVGSGGLRKGGGWFIAQTDKKDDEPGYTINKALAGIRTLWAVGNRAGRDDFKKLAVKGLKFMVREDADFKKDDAPGFLNYVPMKGKDPIMNAWMYYGLKKNGDPYYLPNDPKNGGYQLFCMKLLASMMSSMGQEFPMKQWRRKIPEIGMSPVQYLGKTYRNKVNDGGLWKDSKSQRPGRFGSIFPDTEALTDEELNWFK